jgi:hypothetical protein
MTGGSEMQWQRGSKYHLESVCGVYTVARYHYADETPRYGLWHRVDPKTWVLVDFFDSADEAKQKAEERNG